MVTPERSVHFRSEVRKGTVAKLKKLIPFYCVVLACQRVPEADGIMHNFLCRDNTGVKASVKQPWADAAYRERVRYATNARQAEELLKGLAPLLCPSPCGDTAVPQTVAPITVVLAASEGSLYQGCELREDTRNFLTAYSKHEKLS